MKKLKTSLVLLALIFASGAVMATGNLKVNVTPVKNEKAVVNVSSTAQSHFEIELRNDAGDLVFYKETNSPSESYNRLYDFSNLEDGLYTFKVKLDKEVSTSNLSISNGDVTVVNERKDAEPYFTLENNKLKLSFLNFENENVKLYLYDNSNNELVLEKDLESGFAINYGLDFTKAKNGNYDAVLTSENKYYRYNVVVD